MNRFSRIRHHVNMEDVKRRHLQEVAAKKLEEKILKKETEQIKEKYEKLKSNWRREDLREFGEWVPISSGPTNSSATTFGYFAGGEQQINYETGEPITFTYSGLDGIENYPSTITVDQGAGEVHTTNAPPFSQLGVQGYAAKINPEYKAAQEKYNKELKEWKKKENANLKAIKDTLKSFGTNWEEMRASKKWVKKLGDGTVVAIIPTDSNPSPMNWTNNVRVVKLKQHANASGPMSINYNPPGQYQDWVVENSEVQSEVYLQIGEQPKAPMESQYLMPRRTDFKDVNPQLDASQEFAQKVDADYMMNARVQDTPEQPSFKYDPSKMEREVAQIASSEDPSNRLSPSILPQQDAVLATLQYAFGLYDPKKIRKGGQTKELEKAMLNTIGNSIRRGDTSGRVYGGSDYYGEVENIPAQAFLNNYGYSITGKGIVVDDRFNLGSNDGKTPYTNIGGAFGNNPLGSVLNPAAQFAADRLVDVGDAVSRLKGVDPRDDARAGFAVQYTIPWSRIPANHPAHKLKRKKKKKKP